MPHDAYPEAWDIDGLDQEVKRQLNLELPLADWAKEEGIADEELRERIEKAADEAYAVRDRENTRRKSCAMSKSRCCCRRSTTCGANISSCSTICAR